MGMIDDVVCEIPLPEDAPEFVKRRPAFQTYDLGRSGGEFVITKDGQLQMKTNLMTFILMEAFEVTNYPPPIPLNYKRKRLELYTSNLVACGPLDGKYVHYTADGTDYISITYVVQIRNGKVSSIKEKFRDVKPALVWKKS